MAQIVKADLTRIKTLTITKDGTGRINIPKQFIDSLSYKNKDELFIIFYKDKLMVIDEKNFPKLKLNEQSKIKKTVLSGFKTKSVFVYTLYINKEYIQDLNIEQNNTTTVNIQLKPYGLIISKNE